MKRQKDDTPEQPYTGPSILDRIPKVVLTNLILRDWGNFEIRDLLRFCNTGQLPRSHCDKVWTDIFRREAAEGTLERALIELPLPFPRFIANEMVFLAWKDRSDGERRHLIIEDGTFRTLSMVVYPHNLLDEEAEQINVRGKSTLYCIFMGEILTKKGTPSIRATQRRERQIMEAMSRWYTPTRQERSYVIPYETMFDVLQIFYNWVLFNMGSPTLYRTPFSQLHCQVCGNEEAKLKEQESGLVFCNKECQKQYYHQ